MLLRLAFELFASAVAPNRCAACDQAVPLRTAFCPACAATLARAPSSGSRDVAPFLYGGALARAIVRFKYERRADLARPLSALLLRSMPSLPSDVDLVVPVPLYPARLVERGFNQAALIAAPLARSIGAPFAPRALARTRDTARQATLDRRGRLANVLRAFVARAPGEILARHVLLVDDVRTTGATLAACERAATSAGARAVTTLVIARADGPT